MIAIIEHTDFSIDGFLVKKSFIAHIWCKFLYYYCKCCESEKTEWENDFELHRFHELSTYRVKTTKANKEYTVSLLIW